MSMIDSLFAYMERGLGFTVGMTPETGPKGMGVETRAGYEVRSWGSRTYEYGPRVDGASPVRPVKHSNVRLADGSFLDSRPGYGANAGKGPLRGLGGPMLGIGMSSYFIYQGYQENGMKGAFDAGVLDVSASAAIGKFAFDRVKGTGAQAGHTITSATKAWTPFGRSALLGMGVVGYGAFTGATIGQDMMGTPGAVAGGFAGGGLMKWGMGNPKKAIAAAVIAGGLKMAGSGAFDILKSGYRRQQERKGLDTAGDTAAFYTRQAVTMRQRAMQSIHKSHTNARSALGQEATFMHMPERNYFSTYRKRGNMV